MPLSHYRLAVVFAMVGLLATVARTQTPAQFQFPPMSPMATPPQPNGIPLASVAEPQSAPEQWDSLADQRVVRNIVVPTLTPFLPDPSKATGAAVIVAPGGGFRMLSIDHEGSLVAQWLADHGIAAFVLKYRLNPSDRDVKVFQAETEKMISSVPRGGITAPAVSLQDAEAAMKMVRSRSAEWKVDPGRVGMVGFSAGAELTLEMGLLQDKALRPDFIGVIYGPLGARPGVPADAPPMFNAVASDDPLFGNTDFGLIKQWRGLNRPVEFHYYEGGSHGFGMRHIGTTSDLWIDEFYAWTMDTGWLKKK